MAWFADPEEVIWCPGCFGRWLAGWQMQAALVLGRAKDSGGHRSSAMRAAPYNIGIGIQFARDAQEEEDCAGHHHP